MSDMLICCLSVDSGLYCVGFGPKLPIIISFPVHVPGLRTGRCTCVISEVQLRNIFCHCFVTTCTGFSAEVVFCTFHAPSTGM